MFKNLRDGNVNPREVLKDQINFKSDLGEIRKENLDLKSEEQISEIQNVANIFDLRENIIEFFEIILFCSLKLNTKQNVEKDSKYEALNKCFKDCQ